jgi:hypothetical protein
MEMTRGRRLLLSLGWVLVVLVVGCAVGFGVSRWIGMTLQDAGTVVGILTVAVGVTMSMRGNPSGTNLQGMGTSMPQYSANANLDIMNAERDITGYRKDFRNQSVFRITNSSLVLILGGILTVLASLLVA